MSFALATVAIPGYLASTWKADPVHSEVAFSVRHLMISNIRGRFTSHDVTIVTGENPRDSSVTATIDLASLDTGDLIIPMDGGLVVGDKVSISLEIEAVLQN